MPPVNSLKKNYEFNNIFLRGKRVKGENIDVIYLKNNFGVNRVGIATSKKIGNSVVRNRIRRLIRENYRLIEKDLVKSFSLIIMWKKEVPAVYATYDNIKEDLVKIFNKEKMYKE